MQAVILAAGAGTRMQPLTLERPKPLIGVCGRPLLAHIIDALPQAIDEVILVISYKGDMIREYCGEEFQGRRMRYVTQENPKAGTADALFCAKPFVTGKFLVMYGDDIHGKEALERVIACEHGILGATSETPERFGVLSLNEDGTLKEIIEKPENPPSNLVNIGGFVLSPEIFEYYPKDAQKGEYLLTDSITAYTAKHPLQVIRQDVWIPLGYPEDVAKAEATLCPKH